MENTNNNYSIEDYEEELNHLCAECGCVYVYEPDETLCPACKHKLESENNS